MIEVILHCRDGPASNGYPMEGDTPHGRGPAPRAREGRKAPTMITAEQRRERVNELASEGVVIPSAVYGVIDQERAPSDVLRDWSWSAYLWDRPTAKHYSGLENALGSDQEAWDMAQKFVSGRLEFRAARQQREADEQRPRDAEAAKRGAEELDALTERLRQGYFRIPGTTEEMFQRALPNLLERHRFDAALEPPVAIRSPLSARDILAS